MTGLAAALPLRDLVTLDAPTDAALVWALVRHRLRAGEDPADVLAETVIAVEATAPGSRLNLLLTDGTAVWATTWTHALSVRVEPDAVTVASEPTDAGPGWDVVPDRHLVVAAPGRCDVVPLAAPGMSYRSTPQRGAAAIRR
jgi:glutamine amidotransferase